MTPKPLGTTIEKKQEVPQRSSEEGGESMVTTRGDTRTKADKRPRPPKKRTEKETAEFVRNAYRKIHKRPERHKNFRYHHYA
jgi:hypothetical protein